MKKIISFMIALSFVFSMAACGKTEDKPSVGGFPETTGSTLTADASNPADIDTENESAGTTTEEGNGMKDIGVFDFETKTVLLSSGYEMPIYGIGTYSLTDETCVASVSAALESGVRLIDTAYMYHNEESVGMAVRDSGIPREEIFVITKLYPNQFSDADAAIEQALEKLDIGYIDMMLLHHPGDGDVEAYHAMERAVEEGKIHSIGLSN